MRFWDAEKASRSLAKLGNWWWGIVSKKWHALREQPLRSVRSPMIWRAGDSVKLARYQYDRARLFSLRRSAHGDGRRSVLVQ